MSAEWIMVFLTVLIILGGFCMFLFKHFASNENASSLAEKVEEVKIDLKTNNEEINKNFEVLKKDIAEIKEMQTVYNSNQIYYQNIINKNQTTLERLEKM